MWRSSSLQVFGVALFSVLTAAPLSSAQTVFTQYPTNTTAPLGVNVTLTCASNENTILWEIDGVQLAGPTTIEEYASDGIFFIPTVMEDSEYVSRLMVYATVENNQTMLLCLAGPSDFNLDLEGEVITFTVYGKPLAPTQASLTADTLHQLTLSWGPPFTLPGEVVTYTVLIENLNTSGREMEEGLESTSYTHSLTEEEATLCHTYQFTVSSENTVGSSENSTTAVGMHPSAPGDFGDISSTVILLRQNLSEPQSEANALLTFQTPHTCFPLTYNVTISTGGSTSKLGPFPYSGTGMEQITLPALEENAEYTATVSAENEFLFSTQSAEQTFFTTDVQSVSVQKFENGTLQTTCTFAEGTAAQGCQVTVTFNRQIDIRLVQRLQRMGDELLVLLDHSINPEDTPSAVVAQDIEKDSSTGSFLFTGSITIVGGTTTTGSGTPTSSMTMTSSPDPTPTTPPGDEKESTGPSILTIAIPAGVGVAILFLLVVIACCFICCAQRRRNRGYGAKGRHDTLPYNLPLPNSPTSLTPHDYKEIPPHIPGNITEMSYNPLYGDALPGPVTTFEPPLPALPKPSNGVSSHDTITLPSNPPPLYEEISAAKASRLAANPQYGHVGGAGVAADNPQYGAAQHLEVTSPTQDHMYASLKEPGVLSEEKKPLQYAQPYEHMHPPMSPAVPIAVPIPIEENVAYSPSPTTSSPQTSV